MKTYYLLVGLLIAFPVLANAQDAAPNWCKRVPCQTLKAALITWTWM